MQKATAEIGKPGDAYKHMTWKGFASQSVYDLGFLRGVANPFDSDGKLKLEIISKVPAVIKAGGQDGDTITLANNCPFFKFAVAYKP